MKPCDECKKPFEPKKPLQRFCSSPCRSAWHRHETLPGIVKGLRQLANGQWSALVYYPVQPIGISAGTRVRLETE